MNLKGSFPAQQPEPVATLLRYLLQRLPNQDPEPEAMVGDHETHPTGLTSSGLTSRTTTGGLSASVRLAPTSRWSIPEGIPHLGRKSQPPSSQFASTYFDVALAQAAGGVDSGPAQ